MPPKPVLGPLQRIHAAKNPVGRGQTAAAEQQKRAPPQHRAHGERGAHGPEEAAPGTDAARGRPGAAQEGVRDAADRVRAESGRQRADRPD